MNKITKPDAGPDDQVCGYSYELKGKASYPNHKTSWIVGSRSVIFSDISDPNSNVDVLDGYGTYRFILKETDDLGQVTFDTVEITFNEIPFLTNIEKHCILHSAFNHPYRVISDIEGGVPPYRLLIPPSTRNGRIVGNQWWSDTLNSLESYVVVVKDSKGCISTLVSDDYNCDCGVLANYEYTVPSTLSDKAKLTCLNDCIDIDIIKKGQADTSQNAVNYILHSSKTQFDSPKDVFTVLNKKQKICFNPLTMKLNKEFFVTEVSGMDRNPKDGIVDFMDPCTINYSNSMSITFVQNKKLNAGLDLKVCGLKQIFNNLPNYDAVIWKQISGPTASFSSFSSANPEIISSGLGISTFVYSISNSGCIMNDTIAIEFLEPLDKSRTSYICPNDKGKNVFYFSIVKGKLPYIVIQGNGTIDSSGLYTSEFTLENSDEIVIIEDANGCRLSAKVSHECSCSNDVGVMDSNPRILCQEQCIDIIADQIYDNRNEKLDQIPRDTLIFFVCTSVLDPLNTILFNLKTTQICYDSRFNFGTTYYIGAKVGRANGRGDIDPIKGCVRVNAGTPIVFFANPKPRAGADLDVCGSSIILKTESSVDFSILRWKELESKNLEISKIDESTHKIDLKKRFACYQLLLEEDVKNGLCVAEDTLEICFKPGIEVYDLRRVPRGSDTNSIVSLRIRGGSGMIRVDTTVSSKGKLINNQFISDTMGVAEVFKLRLIDSLLCDTFIRVDNFQCGELFAGELDTVTRIVCEGKCVEVKELTPERVYGDDVVNYIVHKSSYNSTIPGEVLDTFFNINELVCFNPKTMRYGTNNPVYVTRVVGEDINPKDGIVDFKYPCKRASNNFKIIFEPNGLIDAGEDMIVCGLNYWLQGKFSIHSTKWKQLSGIGNAIFSNPLDPNSYVDVDLYGKYCFELSSNSSCGIVSDIVCIDFQGSPEFIKPSAKIICHDTKNQYKLNVEVHKGDPLTRSIKAYNSVSKKRIKGNFNTTKDIWESDWMNNNQNITLELKDTNNCNLDIIRIRSSCLIKSKADTIGTDTALIVRSQLKDHIPENTFNTEWSNLLNQYVTKITRLEVLNLSGQRVLLVDKELSVSQLEELLESLKARLSTGLHIIFIEYKLPFDKAFQSFRKLVYADHE